MTSEAVEVFVEDHQRVLKDLYALDAELNGDLDAARERLERIEAEMRRHFDEEEELLFPPVEEQVEDLNEIMAEHEAVWRAFHRLKGDVEFALDEGAMDVRGRFAVFLGAIRSHIYREDESLFPEVDEALTPGEAEAVLENMEPRNGAPS